MPTFCDSPSNREVPSTVPWIPELPCRLNISPRQRLALRVHDTAGPTLVPDRMWPDTKEHSNK